MEGLKGFVVTIVSMIILISAIQLIAPENSMKKYIKFVLGAILIAVMISPIISLINSEEDNLINKIYEYIEIVDSKTIEITDEDNITSSKNIFKENLEENCNIILKEKFEELEFKTNINCEVDMVDVTYKINNIDIGVKTKDVSEIEKVIINTEDKTTEVYSNEEKIKNENEIIDYLSENLDINKNIINIYKLN